MTTGQDEWDDIRTQVLTDNTAQSVLNHLKVLESNRAHVRTRWVWELLQNARDASADTDAELVASIKQSENDVVFRHNGGKFKREEIIHLIYHGSTKVESEETLGQYGSGFLTTHLLSSEIGVSGQLEDDRRFSFTLKREVGSVDALSSSMQLAERDFVDSLCAMQRADLFTTEFRYPLRGDASDVVAEGIAKLKQCIPFVVVFNREFSKVSIESPSDLVEFKVIERIPLQQADLEQVTVSESNGGKTMYHHYLTGQGERSSVAIPLEAVDGGHSCLPIGAVPRLFLGFPLIGTEHFSFPGVINSFHFTPTENRDGVFLWQADDPANLENQAVLKEACGLLAEILQFASSSGWNNLYHLADIPDIQTQSWLDGDELRECLIELLMERIRITPAVVNESGEAIHPIDAELALADTEQGGLDLWDLLVVWQEEQDIWPRRKEAFGWCKTIKSWAKLANRETSSFDEVIDGSKLASIVDDVSRDPAAEKRTHRVSRLEKMLKHDISAIDWLDQLIGYLRKNGLGDSLREYRIVPSQAGFLCVLPNLHRDVGISPELKGVAELLEWGIKTELRDCGIDTLAENPGAGDWDNDYVVDQLLGKLSERADNTPDDKFSQASINLFLWLVEQERWDDLRGFPVFARRVASEHPIDIVRLPTTDQGIECPLAPTGVWPEELRNFADLFPPNRILADDFFEVLPHTANWELLVKHGVVRTTIVFFGNANVSKFYPDHPLRDDIEHITVATAPITDVWRRGEMMDRVRDSQARARLFWRFLTEWLSPNDAGGLEVKEAGCTCGDTHRYYSAAWLEPLRENTWVRMSNDARTYATEQSLANLLRDSEWDPASLNDNAAAVKLLEAIGVSRLNLVREFVAGDADTRAALDNAFTNILESAGNNIGHITHARQFIEDLKDDQDLPGVLDERRERRRQVHENQQLGSQVETLVKQSLEGEGFTVERTGIGSDFAIEYNDVARLELAKSDRTWLVEVKATRDNRVRMTGKQATTAVEKGEGFLLCVVPVEGAVADLELDAVRLNMRFVENLGPRLDQLCQNISELEDFRNDITTAESMGVQLEVDSGTARVRVANIVWESEGFSIAELPDRLE